MAYSRENVFIIFKCAYPNAHLIHPALSVNTPAPCLEKPADIMSEQDASYKQNLTQRMNTFLCSETKQVVFKAKHWCKKMCQ